MPRKSCYGCPNRAMTCFATCADYPVIVANRKQAQRAEQKINNDWLEYNIAMSNRRNGNAHCRTSNGARIGGNQ